MRDFLAEFAHRKISGGADIYASHWPNWPQERVAILIHSGALHDTPGKEGTAHLLEHLIRYGGRADGVRTIQDFFENYGGDYEPATDLLSTEFVFFGSAEKNFLEKSLALAGERIFNFPANNYLLKKEKGIINGEFRRNNPWQFAVNNDLRECKILFSGTTLERCFFPTEGLPEIIDNITGEDLRAFHRQYYVPANVSILAAGGLPSEEVFRLIDGSVFSAAGGQRVALPNAVNELPPLSENRFDFSISEFLKNCAGVNISRLKISVTLPGSISEQKIKICSEMIDQALDDGVREKCHWSYGLDRNRDNYCAMHYLTMEFPDLPPDKLAETEEEIKSALASLPHDKELFEKIKLQSLKRLEILDYNVENLIKDSILELSQNLRLPTFSEKYAEREAMTMDDVKKIFSHLKPERLWTLAQRP